MSIRRLTRHALTALALLPLAAHAQLATLKVAVEGLDPTTGKVEVSLFSSQEDFMKKPLLQQTRAVEGQERIEIEFTGLVDGRYGIVVVHDEDDNGVYDAGFLGFGGEGLGYSNDAAPWLGRPSFDDVAFDVGTGDLELVIRLR